MTPSQFKAARHTLNLSAEGMADILNVNARTVRRWEYEDGTRPPNPIACRVVEWMLAGWRPPEWKAKG